jgi:transcriptional regulator with XRE-family HTH domain
MARISDSYVSTAELGAGLRRLRRSAGFTLADLAERMGRGKGFAGRLSRLERGGLRYPSVALVADYLRACRSSFAAVAPLLDRYTARPPTRTDAGRARVMKLIRTLPEPLAGALNRYDLKTAAGRKPAPDPARRELRVRRQARAWFERNVLDRAINAEMDRLGVLPVLVVRKLAFDYAHRVWRILRATRPGPTPGRAAARADRLARAEAAALREELIPRAGLELVRDRAATLFAAMESEGALDRPPTAEEARAASLPLARCGRPPAGPVRTIATNAAVRAKYLDAVRLEVGRWLATEIADADTRLRAFNWLPVLAPVAIVTAPGSAERAELTAPLIKASRNPALARRVAEHYFTVFERWRGKLFPAGS